MAEALVRQSLVAQALEDLAPFPGRAALTWRIALLCSIVAATAMLYQIPEAAISCYLIIFLMKPDAVQNIGTAIGLIVLVVIVVACMVPLINATVESPLLRMLAIALVSFVFLFLGAASQLGEIGGVIGLIFAFLLTLVNMAPLGDVVTFGLRYAAYLAIMPMALMVVFNLVLGLSPVSLLRETLRIRLAASAEALASGAPGDDEHLAELLRADNTALEKQAGFVKVLSLVNRTAAGQIACDVRASYRLMLAISALPRDIATQRRDALVEGINRSLAALDAGEMPPRVEASEAPASPVEAEAWKALDMLAGGPEGEIIAAPKQAFFAADALSNPDYQRFALKTTAAAMICYVIYAGINWQGIHTAMITCYVAALGTTGETVHKLGLRILGCLIGAVLGVAAILFVIPQMESIGALMVLIFAGVLVGAWVSTGPERISYGGVQIALAFLLTVLQGFGPSTDLAAAWDRIVGILLGNLVVYLIFTRIWPVPVESAVRRRIKTAIAGLARLAALAPERRTAAVADAALIMNEAGQIEESMELAPFEPRSVRAAPAIEASLIAAGDEIADLVREIYFSRDALSDIADRLNVLVARTDGGAAGDAGGDAGELALLHRRIDRLQNAVIG
ncbi:FUSC family protein [Kaistia dalseonensis]|uniref:Multidrug resistance protein MdtO n=1 Tax=Kaistia dalseonensis TaxID=410840 RepID=A0ABU0H7N3_9HYPH|nr:FUSC family protein [Kaistia dalseonensis]MCX5495721.1 FUSC family protein [Kaistia dalseonensis]MDQ0438318.1 multidrug resistance protein MdtO [Kaistia dalseonensis]